MSPNHAHTLSRSTPEAQGASSDGIARFIQAWEELGVTGQSEPHSFMLLRNGHVIAESWWAPYRADAPQSVYSVSKTFTTMAIGFLVAEGRLDIADPVISFFPGKLPDPVSVNLAAMRVHDLLTMTTGHASDLTPAVASQPDWVGGFLAMPVEHQPGSSFVYNSMATHMLSAIVQEVTGVTMEDYLNLRLFAPLGAVGQRWKFGPEGVASGGWGLSATTETLAKLGQFCLQRGKWNGNQLLASDWIEEATAKHVQQPASWTFWGPPPVNVTLEQLQVSSDYYQGYGYQIWRGRHNSYRADGALAQFIIVLPSLDAVVVMTSESLDWQAAQELVWNNLIPALTAGGTGADRGKLASMLSTRALRRPHGAARSAIVSKIHAKSFVLEPNALTAESVALAYEGDQVTISLRLKEGRLSVIRAGMVDWLDGTTDFPGTPPGLFSSPDGAGSNMSAIAAWADEATLVIHSCFYETPHHDTVTCMFEDDKIKVKFLNSISKASGVRSGDQNPFPETRPVLNGEIAVDNVTL